MKNDFPLLMFFSSLISFFFLFSTSLYEKTKSKEYINRWFNLGSFSSCSIKPIRFFHQFFNITFSSLINLSLSHSHSYTELCLICFYIYPGSIFLSIFNSLTSSPKIFSRRFLARPIFFFFSLKCFFFAQFRLLCTPADKRNLKCLCFLRFHSSTVYCNISSIFAFFLSLLSITPFMFKFS